MANYNLERPGASCTNCCVVGCSNNYANTDKSVKFYSFPGRPHEKLRRDLCIQSVKRTMLSTTGVHKGATWEPKKFSRICSQHFTGNCKSNHPRSPSYLPTIFPKQYKKDVKETTIKERKDRFSRATKRTVNAPPTATNVAIKRNNDLMETVSNDEFNSKETRAADFSCQVNMEGESQAKFLFECTFSSKGDASTQAYINDLSNLVFKPTKNKKVGLDAPIELCTGFHGYSSIKEDNELISLSGVGYERFGLLKSLLEIGHHNDKLILENKLLLFLMKMKLGISYCALGILFGIHGVSVSRIFVSLLSEIAQKTRKFVYWPSRSVIDMTMPQAFKINFPNCRVIIDCTEIKVEQPHGADKRIYMYSHYKSTFTAKFLIGIAPNGFVSFLSKCYGGRSSDSFITNDSGLLNLLEAGDVVLADKGFPGIKCEEDVILVMPPFVHDGRLTTEEVEQTYSVASVRIHVERSIQRIKTHGILNKISTALLPYIDNIVFVCCVLTNLQPPTINEDV